MANDNLIQPTIKGIFVKSHINNLRKKEGDAAVLAIEKEFGRPFHFKNWDDVPVKDEIKIIELTLDVLSNHQFTNEQRSFEAGKLHFRNFASTPYGKILLSSLPKNFKSIILKLPLIIKHIFIGINMRTFSNGARSVKILMENNDYPIEHFQGLFTEWMDEWKIEGKVSFRKIDTSTFEYIADWK